MSFQGDDASPLQPGGGAQPPRPPASGTGQAPSSVADDALASSAQAADQASAAAPTGSPAGATAEGASATATPGVVGQAQQAVLGAHDAVRNATVHLEGVPGVLPAAQLLNRTLLDPLRGVVEGPPPNGGTADVVAWAVSSAAGVYGAVTGIISLPGQLVDTAIASLSSAIMPPGMGFPAACAGATLHIGIPHAHSHPPSLIPPAPPVPLPSLGDATGPGCLTVLINGMPTLRCGDVGFAFTCGPITPAFEIITGSASVFINNKRAARALDMTRICNPMAIFSAMAAASATMGRMAAVVNLATAVLPGAASAVAAAVRASDAEATASEAEAAAAEAVGQAMGAAMAAAQIAADAVTDALRATVGADPGIPPALPGMLTPIPLGPPVLIGGIPVPPIGDMLNFGIERLRERRAVAREEARARRQADGDDADARPRPRTDDEANEGACRTGHPVDAITGANFDQYTDFVSDGLFRWDRFYNSLLSQRDSAMGRGMRHTYEQTLKVRLHRCTYVDELGRETRFPRFDPGQSTVRALGWVLTRLSDTRYQLARAGRPAMTFTTGAYSRTARLASIVDGDCILDLDYDDQKRLVGITDFRDGRVGARYRLEHDRDGHVIALFREGTSKPLAEYGHDRHGCLTRARRVDGSSMQYAYDDARRLAEWTDPNGYRFRWRYDEQGRCVWTSGEDGLLENRLEYGPRSTRVTAGDGGVWTYHHRRDGLLTKREDPYGGVLERLVDDRGRVIAEIDPGGRVTQLLYDEAGAIIGRRDPLGRVTPSALDDAEPPPDDLALPATERERLLGTPPRGPSAGPWTPPRDVQSAAIWALRAPLQPMSPRASSDHLGNPVEVVDELGLRRECLYDAAGLPTEYRDGDGASWKSRSGRWDLPAVEENALGHTTRYRYNDAGRIAVVVDALGTVTEYEYDLVRRLSRVKRHGAIHNEYAYDLAGRLVEKRDGQGTCIVRVEPHSNGEPGVITLASGAVYELDYDARGHVRSALTRLNETESRVECAYDDSVRVVRDERDGVGVRRLFRHDGSVETTLLDRFEIVTTPAGGDGAHTLIDPTGAKHIARTFDAGFVERQLPNGIYDVQQFDLRGRLLGRVSRKVTSDGAEIVWAVRYDRSPEGDLTGYWDSARGSARFEYDAAHRLISYTQNDVRHEIEIDAAGNVISKPGLSRVDLAEGNRLAESGEEVFVYDERHHLAARKRRSDGLFTRYRFDSLGQLIGVEWRDRNGETLGDAWTAEYDALGRRVRFGRGSAQTDLHWDGFRIAAERAPTGRVRVYLYPSFDSLIPSGFVDYASETAEPESGAVHHVFQDPSGLPLAIEDSRGQVVWWASRVDPYGLIEVHPSSTIDYSLRWPGHRHDADLGLHYNRFRDYDPVLGRYLQPDPIGQEGGLNVYAYSANPLSEVDLLGLDLCPEGKNRQRRQKAEMARLLEGIPKSFRAAIRRSMKSIHDRERENARRGNHAQATEMRGEADATLHMLRESQDPNSPFFGMRPATEYSAGSGFDQVWVKRNSSGEITGVAVIEAKGRNATSGRAAGLDPGDPGTGRPPQMSQDWVRSRAEGIVKDPNVPASERRAAQAILDGLDTGDPPVHTRVITGSYRADEAPSSSSPQSDTPTQMGVPSAPSGAPAGYGPSQYPPNGQLN